MSYAGSLTVIRTHLETAGLAMVPPCKAVRLAWPQTASRQITMEYGGDGPSPWGANTFGMRQVGEKVEVNVWVPVSSHDKDSAEDTEVYLQVAKELIKAAIAADENLGGNCVAVEIGDAAASFREWDVSDRAVAPQKFRVLTIPLIIGLADVSPYAL